MKRIKIPGVSIYKPRRRNGRQHKYLIGYVENGKRRVKTASTDYKITAEYAMDLVRRMDRKRLGLLTDREERLAIRAASPLVTLLDEFTKLRRTTGITEKECSSVHNKCLRLFKLMEAEALADFTAEEVRIAIGKLRDEEELALQTCNLYLSAAKRFSKWLDRHAGRHDDVRWIEPYNAATDPQHERRALTDQEVSRLLSAALIGKDWVEAGQVMTGRERELVYLLAVTSGLRANELRTLHREHFHLAENPPVVLVKASNAKNRREARQPLRRDVAERFRAFLTNKLPGTLIWRLPKKAVDMLKADLAAAGIAYETHEGYADFHALRHTYGTRLGKSGASIKVVQRLMRHSDVRLTLRYMHATLADDVAAIEGLAPVGQNRPMVQHKATGTYDGIVQRPFQYAASTPVCSDRFFMGLSVENRSTEPKVAGSSPASCDPQSAESTEVNDASAADSASPSKSDSVV